MPRRRQLVHGRLQPRGHHLVDQARRRPGQRRVGAHAAGVGALVAVADPLEVLRGLQRHDASSPSVSTNRDTSGPSRYSSITTRRSQAARRAPARRAVVGDHDALAGGEAVVLDHVRRRRTRPAPRPPPSAVVQSARAAVGTPAAAITSLANALEPSSWRPRRRAEAGDARGPDRVGHPGDQRRLGPDHHQVGAEPPRPGSHPRRPAGRPRASVGDRADARVARGGVDGGHPGSAARRGPGRARAPGADDEYVRPGRFDASTGSYYERPGHRRPSEACGPVAQDRVAPTASIPSTTRTGSKTDWPATVGLGVGCGRGRPRSDPGAAARGHPSRSTIGVVRVVAVAGHLSRPGRARRAPGRAGPPSPRQAGRVPVEASSASRSARGCQRRRAT